MAEYYNPTLVPWEQVETTFPDLQELARQAYPYQTGVGGRLHWFQSTDVTGEPIEWAYMQSIATDVLRLEHVLYGHLNNYHRLVQNVRFMYALLEELRHQDDSVLLPWLQEANRLDIG